MSALDNLTAHITVSIEAIKLSIEERQLRVDAPTIRMAISEEDCTQVTRELMPDRLEFSPVEFGLGQRIVGSVWNLRTVKLSYESNEVQFHALPDYQVHLHQKLPVVGWKPLGRFSGKIEVPGVILFRLANPGAHLPDVEIDYEIRPGEPNIRHFPDWAEKHFKPDGVSLRELLKNTVTRRETFQPFRRLAGIDLLRSVTLHDFTMTTDAHTIVWHFAAQADMALQADPTLKLDGVRLA